LPGVGPKTAQRMALHLLQRDRERAKLLAENLLQTLEKIRHCQWCRILCEGELCRICSNPSRDSHIICVVEAPTDVFAIEHTMIFRGRYFVLRGHLSPLDGIGPDDIGVPLLQQHLHIGNIHEMIIATNPTVEGEATAHYLAENFKRYVNRITRIAHGVPVGGELEYIDGNTLARAITSRGILCEKG
jgi:recombination protein RecR